MDGIRNTVVTWSLRQAWLIPQNEVTTSAWDRAPEVAGGGSGNGHRQSMAYHVEGICGTLPCSAYESGKELTCVVCSK